MSKQQRAETANRFIAVIAGCGRRFFAVDGRVSAFELDHRGRIWFVDAWTRTRIYVSYDGRWRGFTNGGTMRGLVERLRDYICTGEPPRLNLGPWPKWVCDGDLWGYGNDMQIVRDAARRLGLCASAEEAAR